MSTLPQFKTCIKCRTEKTIDAFSIRTSNPLVYRGTCRQCDNKRKLEWQYATPERKQQYYQKKLSWMQRNPDRVRHYHQEYKRKYPGRQQLLKRLNHQRNPDLYLIHNHRRKARLNNAPGRLRQGEWFKMLRFFGWKCLACGSRDRVTMDHVIPLVMGGANSISNIQPLCVHCNSSKGKRNTTDYRDPELLRKFLESL